MTGSGYSAAMHPEQPPEGYTHGESEHIENTGSGTLRAAIFGISDGLVSNLALVIGVAGGTHQSGEAVVIAGTVGLLAGAFSMAAGEYISMQTQRESMEKQLQLEREHIIAFPEEEQAHLSQLLLESGLSEQDADDVARKVHENVEPAVGFHALLELGIVPQQMGSPAGAAATRPTGRSHRAQRYRPAGQSNVRSRISFLRGIGTPPGPVRVHFIGYGGRGGRCRLMSVARSKASPSCTIRASSQCAPMICMPMGKPS